MAYTRVAAVTGANKGIGLAIVRNIALKYPTSPLNNGPLLIYLTARDASRGNAAISSLHDDTTLIKAKALRAHGGLTDIKYAPLDVSDEQSIHGFRDLVQREHPEGIDVLVNNAGIALKGFDAKVVKDTLTTNYYGTYHMMTTFLPLLRSKSSKSNTTARIVNISSLVGKLTDKYSAEIISAFRDAKKPEDVARLMLGFQDAADRAKCKEEGWPEAAYAVSKSGVTALSKVMAEAETQTHARNAGGKGKVLINSCCPGFIDTDMTRSSGLKSSRTPDRGARTPVLLAVDDIGDVSGAFWSGETEVEW